MALTFTNNGITKPGNGDLSGTWGDTANTNYDMLDAMANGVLTVAISGTNTTLTTTSGALSTGTYKLLNLTGTLASTHTVTIDPNTVKKFYLIRNNTNQSVVFTQGSGGDATLPAGSTKIIYCNGAGATATVIDFTNTLNIGAGSITGSTTVSAAISGSTINNSVIGNVTPVAGTFTTLASTTALTTPLITNAGTLSLAATGTNAITFATNGSEQMRLSSSGFLGVGTTSPAASIHLQANTATQVRIQGPGTGDIGGGFLAWYTNSGTRKAYLGHGSFASDIFYVWNEANTSMRFATNDVERVRINASGGFSVGTATDPGADNGIIAGSWSVGSYTRTGDGSAATPAYSWTGDANTGLYSAGADSIGFATGGNPRLTLNNTVLDMAVGGVGTAVNDGVQSPYTPSPSGGNLRIVTNSGAFTFNAPSYAGDYCMVVLISGTTGAGAVTFSGFNDVRGDTASTSSSGRTLVYITKISTQKSAVVQVL